jgi:hypothetical protein
MNERPSVIHLTAEDRAGSIDNGHDTPFRDRQSVTLCHGMSPELMVGGSRFTPGAAIGDYVVPQGDKRVVFRGSTGFAAQIIGFDLSHPEYTVGVGAGDRGVFVCDHGRQGPEDMRWFKEGEKNVAKQGYYRVNGGQPGNKVVPTITAYMLVNGHGVAYAMYGTAYPIGRDLVTRAERLRVKATGPDGKPEELKGCTLGKFLFTSRFEKKAYTYPVPVAEILGKLGEAGGPTLEEWRKIQPLRQAFKEGGNWVPAEALDPPAPPPELPPKASVTVNDVKVGGLSEVDPPPPEGDADWEIDDLDL